MVWCFLDFQEINEDPRKKQHPVMDRLVSEQPAKSASQIAFSLKSDFARKKRPCPSAALTYLNTR
jgi:hypothetical protein